jgi:D-alanyl-D-alanine carboxypeptidase
MRFLPSSLVIHKWCIEGNKLTMTPIEVSPDGRHMHVARPETVQAYNRMAKDARENGIQLKVIWAFRSTSTQLEHFREAQQKHGKRNAIRWVAPPGFSEHHTGWALDLGDETDPKADDNPLFERTAAFRWLQKNARKYSFELSFPQQNWQGVSYEPWHWRFVGTPEAQQVFHPKKWGAVGVWGVSFTAALKNWLSF